MISGDAPFFVTHFLPLAAAAREQGYEVHVAVPLHRNSARGDDAAAAQIMAASVSLHPIPLRRASVNPLDELHVALSLRALIGDLAPHLVHCIGMKPVLYAGPFARLRRIPAVHAVIGLGLPFMGESLFAEARRRLLLKWFGLVFGAQRLQVTFETEDDREVFTRSGAVRAARTLLLPGVGADLSLFHPRAQERAESEGPPVVMFAARLIAPKGVRDFVAAARRIKKRGIPARFVLQCEHDPANPTAIPEGEIKSWQDAGVIEWWGYSADMPAALRRADIFCLPTYYREGVPKALIEAAATGLPIIASNVPGCRAVVEHGKNGLLVTPRQIDALEAALAEALTNAEFRRSAGEKSREIAIARFSVERFLEKSLEAYRLALGAA
jgi:glycosyltransferase involved in cell wall biosynthesis